MRTPKRLTVAALAMGIASATGATVADSGLAASHASKPKITMISFAGDDYFNGYVTGAKARAKKLGLSLNVQLAANKSPATEAATINAAVAARPDYLLVPPQNAVAMRAALLTANKRGIKVITFDSNIANPTFVLTYVNANYTEYGRRAGVELSRLIGGKGKVLLLNDVPGNEGLDALAAGFKSSIKAPVVALTMQYSQGDSARSNGIIRATLTRNPDLAGIVAISGGGAEGTIAALRAAGKIGKVKFVQLSAGKAAIDALKAGQAQVVVAEALGNIGGGAVQAAYDDANGKHPSKFIGIPLCVITAKTITAKINAPCLHP